MYLFTFLSRVKPKSKAAEEFRDFPNAYINCYVHFKDFRVAEKLAKLLIRERGWAPGERTAAWELQKSKVKTKVGKQLYAEALNTAIRSRFTCGQRKMKPPRLTVIRKGCRVGSPRTRSNNGGRPTRDSEGVQQSPWGRRALGVFW